MRKALSNAVLNDKLKAVRGNTLHTALAVVIVIGEMAEWLKAHAWKACLGETLTWVRIPLSPP